MAGAGVERGVLFGEVKIYRTVSRRSPAPLLAVEAGGRALLPERRLAGGGPHGNEQEEVLWGMLSVGDLCRDRVGAGH